MNRFISILMGLILLYSLNLENTQAADQKSKEEEQTQKFTSSPNSSPGGSPNIYQLGKKRGNARKSATTIEIPQTPGSAPWEIQSPSSDSGLLLSTDSDSSTPREYLCVDQTDVKDVLKEHITDPTTLDTVINKLKLVTITQDTPTWNKLWGEERKTSSSSSSPSTSTNRLNIASSLLLPSSRNISPRVGSPLNSDTTLPSLETNTTTQPTNVEELPANQAELDGYKKPYLTGEITEITMDDIMFDDEIVDKMMFRGKKPCSDGEALDYTTTAGPPASCKSTGAKGMIDPQLNKILYGDAFPIDFSNHIIIDPDEVLKIMPSYLRLMSAYHPKRDGDYGTYLSKVYKICRFASCLIAANAFNKSVQLRYKIYHIRTATPPSILDLYPKLQRWGYPIRILMFGSKDAERIKALSYREEKQASVQADKKDAITKAEQFPKRFSAYAKYANASICSISMFWMQEFPGDTTKASTVLAATFNGEERTIRNEEAFKGFDQFYAPQIKDIPEDKEKGLISGAEFIRKFFQDHADM